MALYYKLSFCLQSNALLKLSRTAFSRISVSLSKFLLVLNSCVWLHIKISINILEHETTRYSVALGTGARTKEARLEYFLKISLNKQGDEKELILEIRDESNYPFDESKILAIEEIEKRLNENFFSNAISRINFSLLDLRYEDTPN